MRRDAKTVLRCGRPLLNAGASAALASLTVLALVGCSRSGPPAPVVDKTGIYFTRPAAETPPVSAAPRAGVARIPLEAPISEPAPRRGDVTREALGPAPAPGPSAAPTSPTRPAAPADDAAGTLTSSAAGTVTVAKGETLYAISRRAQVPLRALIDANGLKPPYALRAGQLLTVPPVRVYVVAPGDTVTAVASRFDSGVSDVIRLNGLTAPDFGLFVGQRLALPNAQPSLEIAPPGTPPGTGVQRAAIVPPLPRVELRDPSAAPPARSARKFGWPLQGQLLSGFGPKGGGLHNDGINIAAEAGTIVRAAENGIVAYVGNELRGYGNLILIRHADGWVSAYAHMGEFLVRRGQVVKRGQPVAKVGASGAVSRPQLHFELRRGNRAVDPKRYLS